MLFWNSCTFLATTTGLIDGPWLLFIKRFIFYKIKSLRFLLVQIGRYRRPDSLLRSFFVKKF